MKKIITLNESQLIDLINKCVSNHIINEGRPKKLLSGPKKLVSKPEKYYLDKIIFKKIDEITNENYFGLFISKWEEGKRPGFSGMVNYYNNILKFNPEDHYRGSDSYLKSIHDNDYSIKKSLSNMGGGIIAVGDIYSSISKDDVMSYYKDFINTWMNKNITPEKIKNFIVDKGYKTKADFLNDANNNLASSIHTIYTQAEKSGILDKIFNEKPDLKKQTKNVGKSIPQQKADGDSSYFKSTTTNPNYDFKYNITGGSNKKLG